MTRVGGGKQMNKKGRSSIFPSAIRCLWYKALVIRGGAIVLALVFCAPDHHAADGPEPHQGLRHDVQRRVRLVPQDLGHLPQNLAILLGISLAVTPAFKMRFWNIGAEGRP